MTEQERVEYLRDELADVEAELEKLYEYWCCDSCHGDDEIYLQNRIDDLRSELGE